MHPVGKRVLGWFGVPWAAKVKNGMLFVWGALGLIFFFIMIFVGYQFIYAVEDFINQFFYDTYFVLPEQHHNVIKMSFIIYELLKHIIWYILGYIIDLVHKPWWYIASMVLFISGIVYVIVMYMSEDIVIQTEYELNVEKNKKK